MERFDCMSNVTFYPLAIKCLVVKFYYFSLCFNVFLIHHHTQKQRKIEFKPRTKLNHNKCVQYIVFADLFREDLQSAILPILCRKVWRIVYIVVNVRFELQEGQGMQYAAAIDLKSMRMLYHDVSNCFYYDMLVTYACSLFVDRRKANFPRLKMYLFNPFIDLIT